MIRKSCCSRFSLHKFVHLKFFWTQFKNVHLRGPCISRPYCTLISSQKSPTPNISAPSAVSEGQDKTAYSRPGFYKKILSFPQIFLSSEKLKKKLSNFPKLQFLIDKIDKSPSAIWLFSYNSKLYDSRIEVLPKLLSFFLFQFLFLKIWQTLFSSKIIKHCNGYSALLSNEKFFKACHFLRYLQLRGN